MTGLISSALILSALSAEDAPFILAKPGVKTAIIITANPPKYKYPYWGGHRILQRYLKQITGLNVRVIKDSQVKGRNLDEMFEYRIWLGRQPRLDKAIGADLDKLDDDGFIIRAVGRDLYMAGKFRWGDHWAAHHVLEKFAGCRWYMDTWQRFWEPKKDGDDWLGRIIPKTESVEVPADTDIVEEPDYKSRWFRPLDVHAFRVRYRDKFHHALRSIIPPATHFEQHPEWYPEVKGKRYQPRHHDDFQPCVSNPELVEFVSRQIIQFFNDNPEAGTHSIGMNDSNKYCECRQCLAVAPAGIEEKRARIAYAFFKFYNEIAERVSKVHPDKRLGCLAYAGLRSLPPGAIKLHPMIVPYLTLDSAQLHDKNEQKEFYESAEKWRQMAARMGIYEYIYGGGFVIPRIYNRYLLKNIRDRYTVGVDAFYGECYPSWGLDGPKYWLISKLLWDNTLDPAELLDEFYANMFGPAAAEMKAYFEFLEETWCTQTLESRRSNYRWLRDAKQIEIFPPAKCDQAMKLLDAAELKTEAPAIRERIRFFKDSFAFTRTLSYRYHAGQRLDALAGAEKFNFSEALKVLQTWVSGGSFKAAYDRAKGLKCGIYMASFDEMSRQFDRVPVLAFNRMRDHLVDGALASAKVQNAASIQNAIDVALQKEVAKLPAGSVSDAAAFLGELIKERGLLILKESERSPSMDGEINEMEWGAPIFSGKFIVSRRVRDTAPGTTKVWMFTKGKLLYMAFKCDGDARLMHSEVEGLNTEKSVYPKLRFDDSISLCFPAPRPGIRNASIRFNAAGALQYGPWKKLDIHFAAKKTDTGWQAEIVFPIPHHLSRDFVKKGLPVRFPIARYYSTEFMKWNKKEIRRGVCSTLYPVGLRGGTIWRGDHEQCMAFISGPRVIYESAD